MQLDEPIPTPLRELLDRLLELWDSGDGIPVAEVMEELRDMLDRDDP